MPSWIEFRLACQGLYRLALLDRTFLSCFDRSSAGAIRSFGLLLPLMPLFLGLVWLSTSQAPPSVGLFLAAKAMAYIYSWLLFPFVILTAAHLLDRDQDAAGGIAIYNWASVLWMALQLPAAILAGFGIAPDMAALLNLAIFVASLVIEGFLFMVAVRLALWQSALLVAVDVVLSQAVIWPISDWLAGLQAP